MLWTLYIFAGVMMSKAKKFFISLFVIAWAGLFHYESLRQNYLNPWLGRALPKIKFLYPPAGWIMFFRVDDSFGTAEVYGIKGNETHWIDPHRIFKTRWLGYDNIHRNIMSTLLNPSYAPQLCPFFKRKFPDYESFAMVESGYPSISKEPNRKLQRLILRCP
ncbi:MAG: hypothetical protein HY547_01330 [Elusimicrobia bacterium]|nr:hypothetical protein [Elusimicrobiota bacterium]